MKNSVGQPSLPCPYREWQRHPLYHKFFSSTIFYDNHIFAISLFLYEDNVADSSQYRNLQEIRIIGSNLRYLSICMQKYI